MVDASLIGPRTQIRGNVRGTGSIEVQGRVEGDLQTDGDVRVTEGGEVLGDVDGASIHVDGTVAGTIRGSDTILLGPTARVVGDLRAARVGIADGARYRGTVETEGAEAAAPSEQRAARQRPAPAVPSRAAGPVAEARATPRAAPRTPPARREERAAPRAVQREGVSDVGARESAGVAVEAEPPKRAEIAASPKMTQARERPAAAAPVSPRREPLRPQAVSAPAGTNVAVAPGGARHAPAPPKPPAPVRPALAPGRQPPPPVVPALARGARGRKKKAGAR